MALMHNDIRQENFTTKPCFENTNCKFYHGQIYKVAEMKRNPSWKQHKGATEVWDNFPQIRIGGEFW